MSKTPLTDAVVHADSISDYPSMLDYRRAQVQKLIPLARNLEQQRDALKAALEGIVAEDDARECGALSFATYDAAQKALALGK